MGNSGTYRNPWQESIYRRLHNPRGMKRHSIYMPSAELLPLLVSVYGKKENLELSRKVHSNAIYALDLRSQHRSYDIHRQHHTLIAINKYHKILGVTFETNNVNGP